MCGLAQQNKSGHIRSTPQLGQICPISTSYLYFDRICFTTDLLLYSHYSLISQQTQEPVKIVFPANTKHLYNVGQTSSTLVQHCTNVIQKFVFAGCVFLYVITLKDTYDKKKVI